MKNGGWFTIAESEVAWCPRCRGPAAWRASKKTGKRYLAAIYRGRSETGPGLVWVTHAPHRCPDQTQPVTDVRREP